MLLGALPVLYWNYQNDWASFRFQLQHGLGGKFWKPFWPVDYLITILLFIFPVYWTVYYKAVKENKQRLLIYLSIPVFLFFLISSFRAKVEGNWSQLAFIPALSLIAFYDEKSWRLKSFIFVWGGALIVLILFWRQPRFSHCPEKLCEPNRYQAVLEIEKNYRPFYASSYQMASFLWFQNKRPAYKLFDMSRTDFYDTLVESKPTTNEFFLVKHNQTEIPPWVSEQGYLYEAVKMIDDDLQLMRFHR
jgi:hypothetical protein